MSSVSIYKNEYIGIYNWQEIIDRLNASKSGVKRIKMGSTGSAHVTKWRLEKMYDNLFMKVEGDTVILSVWPD